MKIIGITGGVGAGKTTILNILSEICQCDILIADEIAKSLYNKNEEGYIRLIELLGNEILDDKLDIDKQVLASIIFKDSIIRNKVNSIIHPLVKKKIKQIINQHSKKGDVDYVFVEAALLLEDNYDSFLDEIWYIYADEKIRRQRLRNSRNYSDEKIDSIFNSQLKDKEFRDKCSIIIDNGLNVDNTRQQLEKILKI